MAGRGTPKAGSAGRGPGSLLPARSPPAAGHRLPEPKLTPSLAALPVALSAQILINSLPLQA